MSSSSYVSVTVFAVAAVVSWRVWKESGKNFRSISRAPQGKQKLAEIQALPRATNDGPQAAAEAIVASAPAAKWGSSSPRVHDAQVAARIAEIMEAVVPDLNQSDCGCKTRN